MRTPLISVIMIFRNAERFIREAIESAIRQSYPQLELLLIDDGCADRSRDIAAHYASTQTGREVRLLSHAGRLNLGMSASRRLGIAKASGQLVAFLDADDKWHHTHLRHEVALLLANPTADMVCGRAVEWRTWKQSTANSVTPQPYPAGTLVGAPHMLTAVLENAANRTPMCSLLVWSEALRRHAVPVPAFTGMYEDQVLLAQLYLSLVCVISGSLTAFYRQHPWSQTALSTRKGEYHSGRPNLARYKFLRWLGREVQLRIGKPPQELEDALSSAVAANSPTRALALRVAQRPRVWAREVLASSSQPRLLRRSLDSVRARSLMRLAGARPIPQDIGAYPRHAIDGHYVEGFLANNSRFIRGRVLEIGDTQYSRRFGAPRVDHADVIGVAAWNSETQYFPDLLAEIPSCSYDCIILTQTLQLVYDVAAVLRTTYRVLKPGGLVLATFPGMCAKSRDHWSSGGCRSIAPAAANRLFSEVFTEEAVEVMSLGNFARHHRLPPGPSSRLRAQKGFGSA